jgi:ABC-2 type transport system permease protein
MAESASELTAPSQPARIRRAGWRVVAAKELADHLLSVRFLVLLVLVGLAAAGSVYAAAGGIRDVAPEASETPALFLRLFTFAPEDQRVPSFLSMVGFLAPLLGIAFGFDAVNGERSQGTLPRLVSQPIHRDDVINGKFAAGITVIGMILVGLTVLVAGLGLLRLGIVPTADEVWRLLLWLLVTIIYVSFWLGLATLCSVALRRAATSALVAIGAWLVLTLFAGLLLGLVTDAIAPVPEQPTAEQVLRNAQLEQQIGRLSPSILYEEATIALLNPEVRTIGFLLPQQVDRAVPGTLSLDQSLLLAWPQTVGLVALTILCFAGAYILFMRQEIRA